MFARPLVLWFAPALPSSRARFVAIARICFSLCTKRYLISQRLTECNDLDLGTANNWENERVLPTRILEISYISVIHAMHWCALLHVSNRSADLPSCILHKYVSSAVTHKICWDSEYLILRMSSVYAFMTLRGIIIFSMQRCMYTKDAPRMYTNQRCTEFHRPTFLKQYGFKGDLSCDSIS